MQIEHMMGDADRRSLDTMYSFRIFLISLVFDIWNDLIQIKRADGHLLFCGRLFYPLGLTNAQLVTARLFLRTVSDVAAEFSFSRTPLQPADPS